MKKTRKPVALSSPSTDLHANLTHESPGRVGHPEARVMEVLDQPMLENAFTQSDYPICITDAKGVLTKVNDAYLQLYRFADESQVLGRTQRIIRSPRTPNAVYQDMWKTISTGHVWRGELTNRANDGTEVFVHLTVSPFRKNGEIAGYMGFTIDRAQQVILERQLFHANKLVVLGTLGAGMAHELNNPLASILLDAEYLRDVHANPAKGMDHASALEAAHSVIRSAERMRRVLGHLLLYSKKDSGDTHSTLSVKQLLEDSLLFVDRQLKSRGIEVGLEVQEDANVVGNRTQLESVFHNLLGNSKDAFDGGQRNGKFIAMKTSHEEGRIRIDYRDNAGGIPKDVMARIFEPFFTTKGGEGTGLGLAISRQIIAQHDGEIRCESEGDETRFSILLPAAHISREAA